MKKLQAFTTSGLAIVVTAIVQAEPQPSQAAFDNANANPRFLRCGTSHPTAEEAQQFEQGSTL